MRSPFGGANMPAQQIGSIQGPEQSPTPTRDPPQGGVRRYTRSMVAVNNTLAAGVAYADVTALWRATNPSVRLHMMIGLNYEPNATEDATFTLPWTTTADAWIRPQEGFGRIMRGSALWTAAAIPSHFESWPDGHGVALPVRHPSAIDEVRGTIVVPAFIGEVSGTGVANGRLWVTATWEPVESTVPDKELQRLFDACRVDVTHGILTSP